MSVEAAWIVSGLLVAHYLGDFTPLATSRMQEAKAAGGPMGPIAAHAGIQGLLTGVVLLLLASPPAGLLVGAVGVIFATHFGIDAGRAYAGTRVPALRDPERRLYWSVFGLDQLAHALVLVIVATHVV